MPAAASLVLIATGMLFVSSQAWAAPNHQRLESLDITGLNHACGTAVDSQGDVYASSAHASKIKVFDAEHNLLTEITNANEPCGLAVDSKGTLYVIERATGDVVKFRPNAYPLTGSPTYGASETFDASGNAKGIAVDVFDDRLYVAESNRVSVFQSDGTRGQNEIQSLMVQPSVTSGTFTVTFEAQTTAPIPYNATPDQLRSALEALSTIGAGNVSVEEGRAGTRSYLVAFTHALGSKDVPVLESSSAGLVGGIVSSSSFGIPGTQAGFAFNGIIAEGEVSDATAVASYTLGSTPTQHYLFVADSTNSEVVVIRGSAVNSLEPKYAIDGSDTPQGNFGFGAEGAALALDWTNGHLFVYDDAHQAFDEFEASGHYLDQTESAAFSNAAPTGIAVLPQRNALQELESSSSLGSSVLGYMGAQTAKLPSAPTAAQVQAALEALPTIGTGNVSVVSRKAIFGTRRFLVRFTGALANHPVGRITVDISGQGSSAQARTTRLPGSGRGRVYVTAGAGAGAKLLAFTGTPAPSRAAVPGLSRELNTASAVAVDSHGDLYVRAGALIRVYRPDGTEIEVGPEGKGIEDTHDPKELAVDSTGKLYVLDQFENSNANPPRITYYTPSSYPPADGTSYVRHEQPVITRDDFGGCGACRPSSIAIDPTNDHLLVGGNSSSRGEVYEFDSAANGSTLIRNRAPGLSFQFYPVADIYGSSGDLYVAEQSGKISVVNPAGTERFASFDGSGNPGGPLKPNPGLAVDQSNGHVLVFSFVGPEISIREFDASGVFVTEFGSFTEGAGVIPASIAIDNSGGPADGTVYTAFDDPSLAMPFDLSAFGPLNYGEPPLAETGSVGGIGGGSVTVSGSVNPRGFELTECGFEYLTDSAYIANGKTFAGASAVSCAESLAAIGSGKGSVAVHAEVNGLDPDARYRFRLVATNEFGPSEGAVGLFGPPLATPLSALPVLFHEATVRASIDPSGLQTQYRFEYGTTESYGQSTPVGTLAAGDGGIEVQAALVGLAEGTTYHFRVVAENEAKEVMGPDRTFATQERREDECENVEYRSGLSANLPDCRAYELVTPAETNGLRPSAYSTGVQGGDHGFSNWLVMPRGNGAGERLTYFMLGTLPGFDGNGSLDGYRAERAAGDHPEAGWVNRLAGPTYEQAVPDFVHTPYPEGTSADQRYSFWLIDPSGTFPATLPAGSALNTPSGFEAVGIGDLGVDHSARSRYLSPGGAHVIFSSDVRLEDEAGNEAPPAGTVAIYDRAAGSAHASVLSLKPDGSPFAAGESATYLGANEAGTALAFSVGGALYLRREGTTTEVAPSYATFDAISENGERVFYTAGGSLWVFEGGAATKIEEAATFIDASPDGSHVFFTTEAGGDRDLHAWDGAMTTLIARLAAEDPTKLAVRSTPDGETFVFESHARLTEYDNEGHAEIYRLDPATPGDQILCVSCDPSGAPPSANAVLVEYDGSEMTATTLIQNVTDDGRRVFFESPDRLLPEDANSATDVYEWIVDGTGGCTRAGGCLALISSGQGEADSHLYGMSADGHDVFIRTKEKLVGADVPGSPSVYDARVEGGIPNRSAPAPCQGDACQGQGSLPPALLSPTSVSSGGGDLEQARKRRCPRGKRLVRRRGKARCVKARKRSCPRGKRLVRRRGKARCVKRNSRRNQRRARPERGGRR